MIKNAKSVITGDDTHAGGLSGDLTMLTPVSGFSHTADFSFNVVAQNGVYVTQQININYTKAINKAYLLCRADVNYHGNPCTITIRRGLLGTIIATHNVTGHGVKTLTAVETDRPVGLQTYYLYFDTTQGDGIGYSVFTSWNGDTLLCDADDTHAGTLSGSNTQNTHESELIK